MLRTALSFCLTALLMLGVHPAKAMDDAEAPWHIGQAQKDLSEGHWAPSLARFRWLLLESDPDLQKEVAYQNTISTITNAHPLRFAIGGALLPSTNITNGSDHTYFVTSLGTFTIDSAEDRRSGIGLHLNGSATYTQAYARGRSWSLTASAATNLYREKELQMRQLGFSAGHEWLSAGQQTQLFLGIQDASYRSLADRDSPDFQSQYLALNRHQRLGQNLWLGIQAQVRHFDYPDRSYNNGHHRTLYFAPRVKLGAKSAVTLKTGVQSVGIEAQHLSYGGKSLGLFFDRNESNGFSWGIGLETHWRDFDSRFPGLAYKRQDTVNDLLLSASHTRIQVRGLTPKLRCTFRDHGSNVALYDYKSTDCSLSLNHQF